MLIFLVHFSFRLPVLLLICRKTAICDNEVQIFFQLFVHLWNFLVEFCLFLSFFTAGPSLLQLLSGLGTQPPTKLLPLLPPAYYSLCTRHSSLCKTGVRSSSLPKNTPKATSQHTYIWTPLHYDCVSHTLPTPLNPSSITLSREWPSFRLLSKLDLFKPYGFCALCLILLLAGLSFPQTSHGLFSPSHGLQHAYHPWEGPNFSIRVQMARAPMPIPPVLRSLSASVCYLGFST